MVIKGKGAMAWKVTEQRKTCVGIIGLVREKTEKFS